MSLPGQHRSPELGKRVATLVATGFGSGNSHTAPGTAGSAAALLVWWVVALFMGPAFDSVVTGLFLALSAIGGTAAVASALKSDRFRDSSDPAAIVIDEWAGMFIALLGVPSASLWPLVAFGLFRLFDIRKPGPVGWAERVPGAAGIMLDDLVAGALVTILFHGLLFPLVP